MPAYHKSFSKILRTVNQTIKQFGMFQPGDSVLIGVSGGPDSVALLYLLIDLAPSLSLRLGIAHLNHGLRGLDSDYDAQFVLSLAQRLGLACYIEKIDIHRYRHRYKLSLEEAGRHIRYRFLKKIAKQNGFNKIAVGHHRDDNAEHVLMYMIRGSGPLGLSGVPPIREGMIVRPLVGLTRSQLIGFLSKKKITYVFDKSNSDDRFIRNRVRNRLIPTLKEAYNPRIVETLDRQASIIRSEEEWLETIVQQMYGQSVVDEKVESVTISIRKIYAFPVAAKRRIIRKAIYRIKGNLRCITFSHIEAVIFLMENGPAYGSLDLPDRIRAARSGDFLIFSKEKKSLRRSTWRRNPAKSVSYEYTILKPESLFIREIGARLMLTEIDRIDLPDFSLFEDKIDDGVCHPVAFFDRKSVDFPMVIRNVRPGDRFVPMGMTGTQKVSKFFINNKIDPSQRAVCPVLLSRNRIIWVVGHRIDEAGKVLPSTRNILKVELFLA